eukprot:TRINITY_DN936_c0_g1_i1.p2 TRINITY_DN936_c0_g1~~TRINITY_DN936_c0_g1_i1.p2  ORF type:complete len:133 (+),score=21.82 TRINITY_DN936_c0_g1_i1:662-1060(+)
MRGVLCRCSCSSQCSLDLRPRVYWMVVVPELVITVFLVCMLIGTSDAKPPNSLVSPYCNVQKLKEYAYYHGWPLDPKKTDEAPLQAEYQTPYREQYSQLTKENLMAMQRANSSKAPSELSIEPYPEKGGPID